jgi:hypothetical protein
VQLIILSPNHQVQERISQPPFHVQSGPAAIPDGLAIHPAHNRQSPLTHRIGNIVWGSLAEPTSDVSVA